VAFSTRPWFKVCKVTLSAIAVSAVSLIKGYYALEGIYRHRGVERQPH
jgi:hypothetical protein